MKKLTYLAAAIATMALAACSESDLDTSAVGVTETTPEGAITFGTNVGKSHFTRAGKTGSANTTLLKNADYGFGVFAYTINKMAYENIRAKGDATYNAFPEFMWNEHISFKEDLDRWYYAPIKYWPNDVTETAGGDVDDQNNDHSNDPATGTDTYDGRVSFFAYAPYVEFETADNVTRLGVQTKATDAAQRTQGIIKISGNKWAGDATYYSDPHLQYVIPTATYKDAQNNGGMVDLLWGTAGDYTGKGVVGDANLGVHVEKYDNTPGSDVISAMPNFNVNADLTKQTTKGTVDFAFKHALSKVGGSFTGTGWEGDDDDPNTKTNGLMVILDVDKDGAELGGELDPYTGTPITTGNPAIKEAWNKYNTKVTINGIELECVDELDPEKAPNYANRINAVPFDYAALTTKLRNQGVLNLATGRWTDWQAVKIDGDYAKYSQSIVPSSGDPAVDATKSAILSEELAEPFNYNSWTDQYTKTAFEKLPIGVTTVAKNVYESEAQPFVFIPGTRPVIKIAIDYTVRTYDEKLGAKYSEVRQKITKRLYITDPVELNKQYNILMHLGITSVKFSATVSDWDVATSGESTTTHDPDTGKEIEVYEEEINHVWLPINVGDADKVVAKMKRGDSYNDDTKAKWDQANAKLIIAAQAVSTTNPQKVLELDGDDAITAYFDDKETKATTTHVTFTTDADWLDVSDNKSIKLTDHNILPYDRTATVKVWYDNKSYDITVLQKGIKISEFSSIKFFDVDDDITVEANGIPSTKNLRSGAITYRLKINYKGNYVNADGTSGTEKSNTVTNSYKITKTGTCDRVTVYKDAPSSELVSITSRTDVDADKTAFETLTVKLGQNKSEGSTEDYGKEETIELKQDGSKVTDLSITSDGKDNVEIGPEKDKEAAFKVTARLQDSKGNDLGYCYPVPAEKLSKTTKPTKFTVAPADNWLKYTTGEEKVVVNTPNKGDKRSTTVTVTIANDNKYNASTTDPVVSNALTVTQLSGK